MQLTYAQYRDKVRACWLGKNIGGTLGAPFECIRGVYDISYYTHDLSLGVLPNDDLDLQLLWLNAAESYGKQLTARELGEYWISYVSADCAQPDFVAEVTDCDIQNTHITKLFKKNILLRLKMRNVGSFCVVINALCIFSGTFNGNNRIGNTAR